jgi:Bacterial Ig-like domain (group 3)
VTSFFGKIPDGETITFYDGSTPIGTGSTRGGVATFTTSSLSVKAHTVKATYAGDSTFAVSSGTAQQVVSLYQSSTKFSVTPNPSNLGEPVTLTATVSSGAPGSNTGQVTFRDGATVLGTASVTNDVATLITSALPQGSMLLTANYKGDTLSLPSSGTTTQTVH